MGQRWYSGINFAVITVKSDKRVYNKKCLCIQVDTKKSIGSKKRGMENEGY